MVVRFVNNSETTPTIVIETELTSKILFKPHRIK